MRRIFAILMALAAIAASAQVKLGVVDVSRIYSVMPEMADAKAMIEKTSTDYQNELEQMRNEFQKKYADFQAVSGSDLSATIKERRLQEIQELDQKIQRFVASAAQSMEQYQEQLLKPIEDKVVNAVKTIGAQGGFTMIYGDLSVDPSFSGNVGMEPLFISSEVIDITPTVLAMFGLGE